MQDPIIAVVKVDPSVPPPGIVKSGGHFIEHRKQAVNVTYSGVAGDFEMYITEAMLRLNNGCVSLS